MISNFALGNSLKRGIIFCLCLCFLQVIAVVPQFPPSPLSSEELAEVTATLRKFFSSNQFNLTNLSKTDLAEGGSEVSGTVGFFDVQGVNLKLKVKDGMKVQEFKATFPATAPFSPMKAMNRIVNMEELRAALPQSILNGDGLNIQSFTLSLGEDGKSFKGFETQLASSNWTLAGLEGLKMNNTAITLFVKNEAAGKKIGGSLGGTLLMAGQSVDVNATLTNNKEDLEIGGKSNSAMKLGSLLESIGGASLKSEFASLAPAKMLDFLEVPAFDFSIKPGLGQFALNSNGSAGATEMTVWKKGSKAFFDFAYAPNTNFKFAELEQGLAWLDAAIVQFQEVKIRLSNDPQKRRKFAGNPPIGLQVEATLIPTGDSKAIFDKSDKNGTKLVMKGGIDASLNLLFSLDAQMNIDLGSGWKYEGVSFFVENKLGTRGPNMGMAGSIIVPVDGTKLRFGLGLNGQPAALALGGSLNLESIDGNGNLKDWNEPFGVPYVAFGNIGGKVGISGSTLIDHIGINGALKLGKIPTGGEDKRLSGSVDAKIDVDVMDSWIKGELHNFSLLSAIEAFSGGVEIPGEVSRFLNVACENGKVDINPQNKSLAIGGTANFYGMKGSFNLDASKSGFAAAGNFDRVELKVPGFGETVIFSLDGNGGKGPSFKVNMSAEPVIEINGSAKVLGIAVNSDVKINKDGFNIVADGKLFGKSSGLGAKASLVGSDFTKTGNMRLDVDLDLGIIGKVREQILNFVENEAGLGAVGKEIVDVVLPTFDLKRASFGAGLADLNANVRFSVEFEVGLFGETENFVVGVDANLNMNDPAAFMKSMGEAIGKTILDNFNFLEEGWNEFKDWAGGAAEDLGNGVIAVADEIGKGVMAMGNEIASWTKDRHFDAATYAPPVSAIAPGFRHTTITVTGLQIVTADESNGDDVFGRISLSASGADVYYAPGTSRNFFGRSENEDLGNKGPQTIPINHSKHIYSRHGQTVTITIDGDLWEEDTGGDDQLSCGRSSISVTDGFTEQVGYWDAREGDSHWRVHWKVTADPVMTTAKLMEAVRQKNMGELKNRLLKGGDITKLGPEAVTVAAGNRDAQMLALLKKYNYKATTADLAKSAETGYDKLVIYELMLMGAKPGTAELAKAIEKNEAGLAADMIHRGAQPNVEMMRGALAKKQYDLAQTILTKNVKPVSSDLTTYLNANDKRAVGILMAAGVPVEPGHITTAVKQKDWLLVEQMVSRQKPEQAAFIECAKINSTDGFALLCKQGVKITSNEPSMKAIDNNNMEILKLALQNGAEPTVAMSHGMTKNNKEAVVNAVVYGAKPNKALNFAMEKNDKEFFKRLLIEFNASGDAALDRAYAKGSMEYSKLVFENSNADPNKHLKDASDNGKWDFVDLMLVNGGNPNLAMDGAVNKENVPLLNKLLEKGASAETPSYMETASQKSSLPMMNSLLAYGADPNPGMKAVIEKDNYEGAKLLLGYGAGTKGHLATPASRGNAKMTSLLLDYGADPNEGMKGATDNLHENVTLMLLESGAKPSGYMSAPAKKGNLRIVSMLVEFGADPNEGLPASVQGNHYPIATYLIDMGAKPKGLTATASGLGNMKMVILLVDNGDDPEPGVEPAVRKGHFEIMKLLIEDYDVDPKKPAYLTAAVEETEAGSHVKFAKYLLDNGSDPNVYREPKTDNTLLHLICDKKRKKDRDHNMMVTLVEGGGDIEATNEKGWTVLHMAVNKAKKNFESAKYLIDKGANINACTAKGKSILKIAEGRDVKKYLGEKGAIKKCP